MDNYALAEQLKENINQVFVGKEETVENLLICFLSGGHVLLEDVPGVGKTTLALALAKSIACSFGRIQFTPDTLPGDVTGVSAYNMKTGEFVYQPGAVMNQVILADEINRTSPKTQSSLLEAMAEGQVTVDGRIYSLPQPFLVIATQNPVEFLGTYPLPEAQLDRFMIRLSIGYPSTEDQIRILDEKRRQNTMEDVHGVVTRDMVLEVQNYLSTIRMTQAVLRYMTILCERTREDRGVELGVSPRGIIALSRMARAKALLGERDYVVPEDVRAVFQDVCGHRVILKPQAKMEGRTVADLLNKIMDTTEVPEMPGKRNR